MFRVKISSKVILKEITNRLDMHKSIYGLEIRDDGLFKMFVKVVLEQVNDSRLGVFGCMILKKQRNDSRL